MTSINTKTIAKLLQHYSALVITGTEKSGRSLIAVDILKEKIKINSKIDFAIFTSTSDNVYRKHFLSALIFDGDNIDELLKIQKKTTDSNDDTSYVLILDDCGRKMFEQINRIVTIGSNYNMYVILIPSPIHIECIEWDQHKFDYIIKADKEKSIFETNKKSVELINSNISFENLNDKNTKTPNVNDISLEYSDSDTEIDKTPDFTIEQLHEEENIPKKETLFKYSYKISAELLKKDKNITEMINKMYLSM